MWCQNCNTYIPKGAAVCPNCKKPIAEVAPEPRPATPPAPPPLLAPTPPSGAGYPASPYGPSAQQVSSGGARPPMQGASPWVDPYGRPQPGEPPEEKLFGLVSRRDLMSGGIGGVAGLLVGAGATSALNSLKAPPATPLPLSAQYWGYTDASGLTVRKVGSSKYVQIPAPVLKTLIKQKLPNMTVGFALIPSAVPADYMLVAVQPEDESACSLFCFAPAQLASFPNVTTLPTPIKLSIKTGSNEWVMSYVYDVRVFTNSAGTGAAVAGADINKNPMIAWIMPLSAQVQTSVVSFVALKLDKSDPVQDMRFAGPTALESDTTFYLSVWQGGGSTTISATTQVSPVNVQAPAPTPSPQPTAIIAPTPTNTTSPSNKPPSGH